MDGVTPGRSGSQQNPSAKELIYLAKREMSSFSLSCSLSMERKEQGGCVGDAAGVRRSSFKGPQEGLWETSTYKGPIICGRLMMEHSSPPKLSVVGGSFL